MAKFRFFVPVARCRGHVLFAGIASILLLTSPAPVFAQSPPQDQMQSRTSTFSVESVRSNRDPSPVLPLQLEVHPLFPAEVRVDLSLEGRCYYFLEDPCFFLQGRLIDYARQILLPEATSLLSVMLEERRVADRLRQSINYRMRQSLLSEWNEGSTSNQTSQIWSCTPDCPYVAGQGCVCPLPRGSGWRQLALGLGLMAAGAAIGFSNNDWTPDEGWIGGVTGAAGIWIVSRQVALGW